MDGDFGGSIILLGSSDEEGPVLDPADAHVALASDESRPAQVGETVASSAKRARE